MSNPGETPHVHGPDCEHNHEEKNKKNKGEAQHVHGPNCGHDHEEKTSDKKPSKKDNDIEKSPKERSPASKFFSFIGRGETKSREIVSGLINGFHNKISNILHTEEQGPTGNESIFGLPFRLAKNTINGTIGAIGRATTETSANIFKGLGRIYTIPMSILKKDLSTTKEIGGVISSTSTLLRDTFVMPVRVVNEAITIAGRHNVVDINRSALKKVPLVGRVSTISTEFPANVMAWTSNSVHGVLDKSTTLLNRRVAA